MNHPRAAIEAAIFAALGEPARAPLLLVAVSGGLDSMLLAHTLHRLRAARTPPPFDLLIAHFDHALRADSAADAAFVAQAAARWGLPFATARRAEETAPRTGSLEADARAARYGFLAQVARDAQAEDPGRPLYVLTAHHADDQAETLLLNLLRGSGVAGLAGMRSPAPLPGAPEFTLLRPLLNLPRATLEAAARAAGLQWRDDATNAERTRARNVLRHDVLPQLEAAFPGAQARLVRTAALLADEADRLEAYTSSQLAPLTVDEVPDARIRLDAAALAALPLADRRAVLHLALARTFGQDAADFATAQALAEATAHADSGAHGPHTLPGGLRWTLLTGDPPQLSLHRAHVLPLPPPGPWLDEAWRAGTGRTPVAPNRSFQVGNWRLYTRVEPAELFPGPAGVPSLWHAWLRADVQPLFLRAAQPGDVFAPLGMNGRRKNLGDLFTDRKIPPALRPGWPVVCTEADEADEIVWVCGLALAQRAAVAPGAPLLLHLRWLDANAPELAQPRQTPPRAFVKPLMHWAIHKGFKLRFIRREPANVEGILLLSDGPLPFAYNPTTRTLRYAERTVTLSEWGWETAGS